MHRVRRIFTVCAVVVLAVSMLAPATSASPGAAAERVEVIAVFDEDLRGIPAAEAVARRHGVELGFVYTHALQGFSGSVPEGRLAALANDPRIASVELNAEATIATQDTPTGVQRIFAEANPTIPTSGDEGGAGRVDADIAILDTGIDEAHPDLDVVERVDCTKHSGGPPNSRTYACRDGGTDRHGHGTHVAGTAAALDNDFGVVGVAPGARLWSVKVLDDRGSGNADTVIAGLDFVAENAGNVDVANMSLGFSVSLDAVDRAIENAHDSGVAVVVAAGNDAEDASNSSPGSAPEAIVVAALADYDGTVGDDGTCTSFAGCDEEFATFSNDGPAVDLIAPGVSIESTYPGGGTRVMSGTSMAAPHVAGAAAILASKDDQTPETILDVLRREGNDEWKFWTSPDGSSDTPPHYPLLDVGDESVFAPTLIDAADEPAEPEEMTVEITAPSDEDIVSGVVEFTATTTGDVEVVTFRFANEVRSATPTSAAGEWTTTWDTTKAPDGEQPLAVAASGSDPDVAVNDAITIDVRNGTDPEDPELGGFTVSLDGDSQRLSGGVWTALVNATITGEDGEVQGAKLSFIANPGGADGCTTDQYGACSFGVTTRNRDSTVVFSLDKISIDGEGDLEGWVGDTTVTVTR